MDVAGQHHQVIDRLVTGAGEYVVDAVASGLVAVRCVGVEEYAATSRVGRGHDLELREHHALAQELPLGGAGAQLVEEPCFFGGAERLA